MGAAVLDCLSRSSSQGRHLIRDEGIVGVEMSTSTGSRKSGACSSVPKPFTRRQRRLATVKAIVCPPADTGLRVQFDSGLQPVTLR